MLFSSIEFFIFFLIFSIISIKIDRKYFGLLILSSSYIFYAYNNFFHSFILIYLSLITLIQKKKNYNIILILFLILLPLVFYKYFNFFISILNDIFYFELGLYDLGSIPIGLSFITFTIIAYLVDIKKNFKFPHTNLDCLNYIFFFPQLIAGPILRPSELLIQLKTKFKFNVSKITTGIGIFSVGMIKKVIFADTIGQIIDPTFGNIDNASTFDLWVAFFLFPQQIYFDFSGYTHMAIGLAYILNIELPENFNSPYLTTSITNFWKSWHMTLSRWIRDYIFIPLGGSRVNFSRNILNILIAMSLSGLWHGANYTFIIWGFLNGFIICLEKVLNIKDDTVFKKYILIFLNLFFIFNLWVIFRSENLSDIFSFYFKMYQFDSITNYLNFIILILVSLILIFFQKYDRTSYFIDFFSNNIKVKLAISITLVFLCLLLNGGQSQKFIYFDF